MKKLFSLSFLLTALNGFLFAEIQWASKVIEYSSQNNTTKYSAKQALGKPNAMPQGGDSYVAWAPGKKGSKEFIHVGFDKPMKIKQVIISEPFNATAIRKVILYDASGKKYNVYKGSPKLVVAGGRIFHIKLKEITATEIVAVRVELMLTTLDKWSEIDAIGISDTEEEYVAKPNVATDINFVSKKENLGKSVNSTYAELMPVIAPDGKTLYMIRDDDPKNVKNNGTPTQDIYYCEMQIDGSWSKAKSIGSPLNNDKHNFVSSVTPDGNKLLVNGIYVGETSKGLSFASKNNKGTWDTPKKLDIKNYYNNNSYNEFSLSNSGKILVLSIEQDDSYGDKDLYVCFLQDDGSWSAPINMGMQVNTGSDESTPFLAADDKTIYFSSSGYSTFGSNDIFVTRRLDDTWKNWSEPQNLGPQLNTSNWDAYYTITASGDYAYFISSANSLGGTDVFRVALPKEVKPDPVVMVSGKVLNAKTNEPISANISYQLLPEGKEVGIASSNPNDGSYKIVLPSGKKYAFSASAPGFIAVNENMDLSELKEYKEVTKDLFLVPIEVGQTVRLNNIFFDIGKADLLSESYLELDKLVKVMNQNPTMEIEIEGHTDNVGSDPFNLSLSKNRAKAVYDYLISKGIDASRIKSNGYGETKPLATNDNDEGRAQNRRVQFTIVKK